MKAPFLSLPLIFFLVRSFLFLSLSQDGLTGYGDFIHFHSWATNEGWPYFDYWVEFPPVFPLLNALLFRIAGGREHVHAYLLAFTFTLAQAGSLALFIKLAGKIFGEQGGVYRGWVYFALLAGLFYGWGYFDPLAVLALLLGLWWIVEGEDGRAAVVLGIGTLVKWFPILALPALWRYCAPRRAIMITGIALVVVGVVFSGLYLVSPEMTLTSLRSQGSKGSWETVWALIDGNIKTGNFQTGVNRTDPKSINLPSGNPPRISLWLTLFPIAGLGLWLFSRAGINKERGFIAFVGLTMSLFFLWSPGWSPQWTLYLLPLILLVLRQRIMIHIALVLVLVNLLEWPWLLSRGYFWGLWITIPLRTWFFVLLTFEFWKNIPVYKSGRLFWR